MSASYIPIFLFIGGVFWTIVSGVTVWLHSRCQDHEKRIQRIEDVQGTKIDRLAQDLQEFKHEVTEKLEVLTGMVHREKNQEQQINTTLKLLLEHLIREDETRK